MSIRTPCSSGRRRVGEDDLFTYLYTSGTTGPPKGWMIRHRNYYEMVAFLDQLDRFTDVGRPAAPLSSARAQLRPADAPLGPAPRLHDCVPARIRSGRPRRCPPCGPTVFPSVPRVYEKVHAAVQASSPRLPAPRGSSTGRCASAAGSACCASRAPRPARPALQRRIAAQARLRQGDRPSRWHGSGSPSPAVRRSAREVAEFFHAARSPDPRGVRADRVHHRRDGQPPGSLPLRHGRGGHAGRRAAAGGRRGAAHLERNRLRRLPQGRGGHAGGPRRRWLAAPRRRGARWTEDGFLQDDSQSQEGHPRHRGQQERRARRTSRTS